MSNPYAGEVDLTIDGVTRPMKLTLGALAELEDAMGAESLVAVVDRFEAGAYRTRDVLYLLRAGLRGGGWQTTLEGLAEAEIAGGPVQAARAAALLLARAFAVPSESER